MLHPLLGRTLLGHVLDAAEAARPTARSWSSGTRPTRSRAHLAEVAPAATPVLQAEQNGTGHAVRIALDAVPEAAGTVVVLNGDVPLLRPETVDALVRAHEAGRRRRRPCWPPRWPTRPGWAGSCGTPPGIWSASSRSGTPRAELRAVREVNAGIYAFDAALLREALGKLSPTTTRARNT